MKINGNIIAHRGVHDNKKTPENSLEAFQKAIEYNYPIELDVQLTKDNILVVFHDFTLTRMTKNTNYIQDTNYQDIKDLKLLNTNEKIPTLKEVLELVDNKFLIDIEIKNTNKIKETCDILINELKNYSNYIIKSFNPRIIKYLKTNYKELEVGLLITDKSNNFLYNKLLKSNFILKYCNPDFLAISKTLLDNKKFRKLSKSIPTLIWTIEDKKEIIDNNLIYICNNLPYINF